MVEPISTKTRRRRRRPLRWSPAHRARRPTPPGAIFIKLHGAGAYGRRGALARRVRDTPRRSSAPAAYARRPPSSPTPSTIHATISRASEVALRGRGRARSIPSSRSAACCRHLRRLRRSADRRWSMPPSARPRRSLQPRSPTGAVLLAAAARCSTGLPPEVALVARHHLHHRLPSARWPRRPPPAPPRLLRLEVVDTLIAPRFHANEVRDWDEQVIHGSDR